MVNEMTPVEASKRRDVKQHVTTTSKSKKNGSRNYPADIAQQRFLEESINRERDTRLHWYFAATKVKDGDEGHQQSRQMAVFRRRIEGNCPRPNDDLQRLMDQQSFVAEQEKENSAAASADADATDGKHLHGSIVMTSSSPCLITDMRPLDGSQKKHLGLYSGISREGKGRYQYLRSRYFQLPEQRYNFPVLSSWEYGWGLGELQVPSQSPRGAGGPLGDGDHQQDIDGGVLQSHARTRIVADSFYGRNGIATLRGAGTRLF